MISLDLISIVELLPIDVMIRIKKVYFQNK